MVTRLQLTPPHKPPIFIIRNCDVINDTEQPSSKSLKKICTIILFLSLRLYLLLLFFLFFSFISWSVYLSLLGIILVAFWDKTNLMKKLRLRRFMMNSVDSSVV